MFEFFVSVFGIFCFFFIVIDKFYWFVDIGCICIWKSYEMFYKYFN